MDSNMEKKCEIRSLWRRFNVTITSCSLLYNVQCTYIANVQKHFKCYCNMSNEHYLKSKLICKHFFFFKIGNNLLIIWIYCILFANVSFDFHFEAASEIVQVSGVGNRSRLSVKTMCENDV